MDVCLDKIVLGNGQQIFFQAIDEKNVIQNPILCEKDKALHESVKDLRASELVGISKNVPFSTNTSNLKIRMLCS